MKTPSFFRPWRWMTVAAALAAGAAVAQSVGDAWDWPLPPRGFGALSQSERVEYGKAEDLFRKGSYDAAAVAFEKFAAEHPASAVTPRTKLLQGYSLLLANQRNAAIAMFTEIGDFHGGNADVAAPALYFKAQAELRNGNADKGRRTLQELTENDKYLQNPIADAALNQLADMALAGKDEKAAESCWLKVVRLFADAFLRPEGAAKEARAKLTSLYIRQQRFAALEDLLTRSEDDAKKRVETALYVYDQTMPAFGAMKPESRVAALKWFEGRRAAFREAQRMEAFFGRALALAYGAGARDEWKTLAGVAITDAAGLAGKPRAEAWLAIGERLTEAHKGGWPVGPEWTAFADSMLEASKSMDAADQVALYEGLMARMRMCPAPSSPASGLWDAIVARVLDIHRKEFGGARDAGFAKVVDLLAAGGCTDRAYAVAEKIEDPGLAMWKRAGLLALERKFDEVAKACEELEQIQDPNYSTRAMRFRADVYKDHLAKYEEAIRLYTVINNPPGTIWAIVECNERWGKPEQAVAACSEIENFFERDAPAAGYRKAQIWERAGNRKNAVAAARAVLKKYPKAGASSQAHQMLERYGIATGGGVMESDE